jgi:lipid-A-disaccharide synthase
VRISAVGGPELRAAGAAILQDISELGAMGFLEVLRQLPRLRRLEERIDRLLRDEPPSVVVPIDYPGFNLRIARRARAHGVPVVYYIGPQVWAWGAGRLPKIAESIDRMLVVFPFEVELYREAGVRTDFTGHPLMDDLAGAPPREQLRGELGLVDDVPFLGLLPGSRAQEVRRILPVMVEAAARAARRVEGLRVGVSVSDAVPREEYDRILGDAAVPGRHLVPGPAAPLIRAADFLLVTSGTATLESALLGTPLAVLYRTSPITWLIGRRVVRIPRISLVNIVAGEDLVAEFLQGEAEPERVAEHAIGYLLEPDRRRALAARLERLRESLGEPGSADRAAALVLEETR